MNVRVLIIAILFMGLAGTAAADEASAGVQPAVVPLAELLGRVSGKTFLVDARVPADVVTGVEFSGDVSYGLLLSILRNNGLAVAAVGNTLSVVPVGTIRQFPLPVVDDDGSTLHDDEWVIRIVRPAEAVAMHLVPILRPLTPQAGHLAADEASNSLIVVAPNGVARNLENIVRRLDADTTRVRD